MMGLEAEPLQAAPLGFLSAAAIAAGPVISGLLSGNWLDAFLGPFLGPALQGRPKIENTQIVAARYLESRIPILRHLGQQLERFVSAQVPLSSSSAAVQQQFARMFRAALAAILEQYPLAGTYQQIGQLLARTHVGGQSAQALAELTRRIVGAAVRQTEQVYATPILGVRPVATIIPMRPRGLAARRAPRAIFVAPAPQPEADIPSRFVSAVADAAHRMLALLAALPAETRRVLVGLEEALHGLEALASGRFPSLTQLLALGGVLSVLLAGPEEATFAAVGRLLMLAIERSALAAGIGQMASWANGELRRLARSIPSMFGQPGLRASLLPSGQFGAPYEAPTLDQTGECLTCSPQGRQIAREERALRQEIQTEESQQTAQQIQQAQNEIDRLRQLESQPPAQRDIPAELEQKRNLLRQLERLGQQVGQPTLPAPQPSIGPSGEQVPTLQPSPEGAPPQGPGPQLPGSGPEPAPAPLGPKVSFCVGCQDEEDAILFLNGEPAKCSVIPGSTKVGG